MKVSRDCQKMMFAKDLRLKIHTLKRLGHEGAPDGDGIIDDGLFLHDIIHIFGGKSAPGGNFGNDFAVIVGYTQHFCQAFAQFPSAAAELTVDRDDSSHKNPPFPIFYDFNSRASAFQ